MKLWILVQIHWEKGISQLIVNYFWTSIEPNRPFFLSRREFYRKNNIELRDVWYHETCHTRNDSRNNWAGTENCCIRCFYYGEKKYGPASFSCEEKMLDMGEHEEMELKAEYSSKVRYMDRDYGYEAYAEDLVKKLHDGKGDATEPLTFWTGGCNNLKYQRKYLTRKIDFSLSISLILGLVHHCISELLVRVILPIITRSKRRKKPKNGCYVVGIR